MEAMVGAGITRYPLWPAFIGAAVSMELVHPDAALGEEFGPFGTVDSAISRGRGGRGREASRRRYMYGGRGRIYDTARVVGDFGLILKDIGGPSVIASMILDEIFRRVRGVSGHRRRVLRRAGEPTPRPCLRGCHASPPAPHRERGRLTQGCRGDQGYKLNSFIDPEMALCSLNTIARKAEAVSRGPITHACVLASEGVRDRAIYRRAVKVYEMMEAGKTVEEAAKALDQERLAAVEKRGSAILSGFTGRKIGLKFTTIRPQGRRTDRFTKKYWAFDALISYDITIDGKSYHIENLSAKVVPEFAVEGKGRDNPDMGTAIFAGAVLAQEMTVHRPYHHQRDGPGGRRRVEGCEGRRCGRGCREGCLPDPGNSRWEGPGAGGHRGREGNLFPAHREGSRVTGPAMKVLVIDPRVSGISGDMLLAALVDLTGCA